MRNYKYTAINLKKEKFSGIFTAEDERDLAAKLSQQNLFLISCSPYSDKTPSAFFTTGTGKVNVSELTTFCRQFAILINSGISVLECLDALRSQGFTAFFKNLLDVIYEDVKSGVALSDAIKKHKKVFPEFFRSMIYVGESSGKLDLVFNSLADYYEKDVAVRRKLKSALSYPIMLGVMTVAIVVLMIIFIVPTFKDTLSGLNVTPEGFTKVVYDFSDFMVANWLYVLAAIVVIALVIFLVAHTKKGSYFFSKLAMTLPVIKKVNIAMMTSRFARAFSLLLSSGMDMSEALEAVSIVITNQYALSKFNLAKEEVKHGVPLAAAFEKYKLFPPLMIQMISVGEKTASLEEILSKSCEFFDEQTETTLTSATSKIQPIMLVIMGGIVGVMFIAVYSPIISIMQNVV